MSGGVDSSVAAYLTLQAGYEAVGCTMKLHDDPGDVKINTNTCCTLEDVEDARSIAYKLGMDFYVFNFKDGFKEKIIDRFIWAYEHGITPNPCIDCNRFMKFDKLFERAEVLNCDHIVTGHYARIIYEGGRFRLLKGLDASKDQSYVLYNLTQEQLSRVLFPVGELTKAKTREIAQANGFINSDKPDSQDICFVPDGKYGDVIKKITGRDYPEGDFTDKDGNVLGRHKGIIYYTLGMRKGLGISADRPLYVTEIDVENNRVILGDDADLYSDRAYFSDVNWISGTAPSDDTRLCAKVRYRQTEQPGIVKKIATDGYVFIFDSPQRAITPGQAIVLYDGDEVVGGGTICGKM